MPYEFGDVVLVRFPFTNQTAFKQRPAVVIGNRAYNAVRPDVVIMAITSQLHSPSGVGEVLVREWQAAHLLKPSAIKPVFATIEQNLILRALGVLEPTDQATLRQAIAAVLGRGRSGRPLMARMLKWPRSKGIQAAIAFAAALLSAASVFAQIAMESFNHFYFAPHKAYPYPYPTVHAAQLTLYRDCGLTLIGVFVAMFALQRRFFPTRHA